MGDRTSVSLTIGGELKRPLLDELASVAVSDGLGLDWEYASDLSGRQLETATSGWALVLTGHGINYALCEATEAFCTEHGLTFCKEWDAGGDYGAGGEFWDGRELTAYSLSQIGEPPALNIFSIRQLLDAGKLADELARLQREVPPLRIVD